ncbi:PD-(D/E)XK nuclease superfamily protein [Ruminobacter amylophilus]|uniref:PD-(D/E)XK nuclease superfamily protein n=1 Tax=Ruminobacter amylophilus TaxID=867 RepID=A0A662ZFD9_9GAMM|nr:PD-(D/E)XK nuclease domain-containing protein [Ruminobacter amylophilus]SFP15407.1 PD-(D/E)XK nuclease superfamily protein [Ruminobacter amylophilus]
MTGLLWSTLDDYSCHSEDQSGKGRVDLVYEPITRRQPLILIEFKYDGSAEEAIAQIKKQEYCKRYTGQFKNIIIVGINYSTKTKDHQCLIEKLD